METTTILQNCIVDGHVIKLPPGQLERNEYLSVKKTLELIGGKWKGGKVAGFVFSTDPTELLAEIATGAKRNLKKEFQFFATPEALADEMVLLANVDYGLDILEPSAGQGAIVKAINKRLPNQIVDCYELMEVNRKILGGIHTVRIQGDDFLAHASGFKFYDRIIANPPFNKNQDIDHIRHMYAFLKPKGVLVSASSTHWENVDRKKEREFRSWLDGIGATIQPIEPDTFKESGTSVGGNLIIINR
jgi:methylase of polypeptide subunit release factors